MLNKAMLLCAGGETPPEPGYVKAKLTVGGNSDFADYKGYYAGRYGKLVPSLGYEELQYAMFRESVSCTRPFYYDGVKYEDGDYALEGPALWPIGGVVEVWLAPE